jgi:hypothetical protein
MQEKFSALMLGLLAVYLVKAGLPALAYFSALYFSVFLIYRLSCLEFKGCELGFVVIFFFFICSLLLNGGAYDTLTLAFVLNLLCSWFVFLSLLTFSKKLDWLALSQRVFYIFVIIAILDTFYKFYFPLEFDAQVVDERDFYEFGFYQFKGSFFYQDSNGLAYLGIPIVALGIEICRSMRGRGLPVSMLSWVFFSCVPTALVVLTLSRAAMVAVFMVLFLYVFRVRTVVSVLVVVGVLFSGWVSIFLEGDLSGSTKLNELEAVYTHYSQSHIGDLFLGVGFGNGEALSGRYIHGALQKIFLELGVLGVALYLGALYFLIKIKGTWRPIFGLILMSFSSNFYFLPSFVVAVLLLIGRLGSPKDQSMEIVR